MAYIDATYAARLIGGVSVLNSLFTDRGSGFDQAALDAVLDAATGLVDASLAEAGYPTGMTDPPEQVKLATFGCFAELAYARKGLNGDSSTPKAMAAYVRLWRMLQNGELRVPSLTPDTVEGVGGFAISESDPAITGSTPQIFGRGSMRGY